MQPKRKCKQLDKNISNLSKMKNEIESLTQLYHIIE